MTTNGTNCHSPVPQPYSNKAIVVLGAQWGDEGKGMLYGHELGRFLFYYEIKT